MQRQRDLLRPRIALPGDKRPDIGVGAERGARVRVADLVQVERIGPASGGGAGTLVGHRPADVDRGAFLCLRRRRDVAHEQIGRRRQRHVRRGRHTPVVAGVDELVGRAFAAIGIGAGLRRVEVRRAAARRLHDEVVLAGDPVRQQHVGRARVALAHLQEAEMVEAAQELLVGAGRRLADIDVVQPFGRIRRADALVGDGPGERQRLAAGGTRRRRHAADHVLRVRIRE